MTPFLVIGGPTASGKSALAIKLAQDFDGEIINADSVAMYRRFDIGTAKPSLVDRKLVAHHLIDILDAEEELDASRYGDLALAKITELQSMGKLPIVVGGSGLYLRALMREKFHDLPHSPTLRSELSALSNDELFKRLQIVDPERALKIHQNDHFRLARALEIFTLTGKTMAELTEAPSKESQQDAIIITIDPDRKILHQRIASRTEKMLEEGLVEEVKQILASGVPPTAKPFSTIGYKQVLAFLQGHLEAGQLHEQILFATRQLAKRQCTWFHKIPSDIRLQNENLSSENLITLSKKLLRK